MDTKADKQTDELIHRCIDRKIKRQTAKQIDSVGYAHKI